MKKFLCLIGHPKRLTRISECNIDDFENDDEAIRVYRCKYCGKEITIVKMRSSNSHYYDDEWVEYECDCDTWKEYEKMNKKLDELNYNIYKLFCNYQNEWEKTIVEYRESTGNKLEVNKGWYTLEKNK